MATELEVTFKVQISPSAATYEQMEEWIKYKLGIIGCSESNPLVDEELQVKPRSVYVRHGK